MGNDTACKTVGIGSIRKKMFDRHARTLKDGRETRSGPEEKPSLLGALEA